MRKHKQSCTKVRVSTVILYYRSKVAVCRTAAEESRIVQVVEWWIGGLGDWGIYFIGTEERAFVVIKMLLVCTYDGML